VTERVDGGNGPVALAARGVDRTYHMAAETIPVLQGLEIELRRGETVAVVGTSGSGKTTMIQVLGLLDAADAGSIAVDGRDVTGLRGSERNVVRNRSFGFVFQFYHLVNELTALENVVLPGMIGLRWSSGDVRREVRERARDLLDRVGLASRERHRPSQLSGGERQRVAIARALLNRPAVLFCDEPTGNLDPRTSAGVQEVLFSLGAEARAMLLVTHDERFARRCSRVLRLKDGTLVASQEEA